MRGKNYLGMIAVASVLSIGLTASTAFGGAAEKPGKKQQNHGQAKHVDKDNSHDVVVLDRDGYTRVVREYYTTESLPPGLAKRQSLPPGLRKQLHERGQLPPGLQKRLTPLPTPLVSRLPAAPPYYTRYFAGRDLLVVDSRTHRIVMLVPDVL